MLISPISHCFCWPLIPKHQGKQWNYVYGEIRSIGLCPVIFPAVKLIHKNVSSLELEHSTSQGEHFCKNTAKEIYPSREGARTTYMWGKMSPEHCKWCTAPVLALPRAGFLPVCPFPHTDLYRAGSSPRACPEHHCSHHTAALNFLFQDEITQITIMAPEESEGGKKSARATTCCKSSKDTFSSHTVPFHFLGVSCWLLCFLSLLPSYQDYYNCLIIPFYTMDKKHQSLYPNALES